MINRYEEDVKQLHNIYSGWGGENDDGSRYGFKGYSLKTAEALAESLRSEHRQCDKFVKINVTVVPMGNGNYRVEDFSTYRR